MQPDAQPGLSQTWRYWLIGMNRDRSIVTEHFWCVTTVTVSPAMSLHDAPGLFL